MTLDEGMAEDPFLRTKIGLFSALVAPPLPSVRELSSGSACWRCRDVRERKAIESLRRHPRIVSLKGRTVCFEGLERPRWRVKKCDALSYN
jgi:hypothetical protein